MFSELRAAINTRSSIRKGSVPLIELPTGDHTSLPFTVISGMEPGPTIWITANVHGNEFLGLHVSHDFVVGLGDKLSKGTVVLIHTMNPTGLLLCTRSPSFDKKDPNRLMPDYKPEHKLDADRLTEETKEDDTTKCPKAEDRYWQFENPKKFKTPQEQAWDRLAPLIKETATALLDLHCAFGKTIPFVIIDRLLYSAETEKQDAHCLFEECKKMAACFDMETFIESSPRKYVDIDSMHRSVAGAVLNGMRIPAITIELGPSNVQDNDLIKTGVEGLFRILEHFDMIDHATRQHNASQDWDDLHRYLAYPRAKKTGVIRFTLEPGSTFSPGDKLAEIRSIHGEIREEIQAEMAGKVIGWFDISAAFAEQPIMFVAVPDDFAKITPWPRPSV